MVTFSWEKMDFIFSYEKIGSIREVYDRELEEAYYKVDRGPDPESEAVFEDNPYGNNNREPVKYLFKDEEAFLKTLYQPCYVPDEDYCPDDFDDCVYTKHDLLKLCGGDDRIAYMLFDFLSGEQPEDGLQVLIEFEYVERCEKCGRLFKQDEFELKVRCPHCGQLSYVDRKRENKVSKIIHI